MSLGLAYWWDFVYGLRKSQYRFVRWLGDKLWGL